MKRSLARVAVDWFSSVKLEGWYLKCLNCYQKNCRVCSVRAWLDSDSCFVLSGVAQGFGSHSALWEEEHFPRASWPELAAEPAWSWGSRATVAKLEVGCSSAWLYKLKYIYMILQIYPEVDPEKYYRNLNHASYSTNSMNPLWILDRNPPKSFVLQFYEISDLVKSWCF